MSVLSLHFGFRGRINRKTYWLAGIVPFFAIELGVFLFGISLEFSGLLDTAERIRPIVLELVTYAILLPFVLFVFWTSHALAIKRLHDAGGSAWRYLVVCIPLIGQFILFSLLLERGTESDNKYGPDPGSGVHWHSSRFEKSDDPTGTERHSNGLADTRADLENVNPRYVL